MPFANAYKVFMTRRDVLACAHEPFGDAFYYGPERLSERFKNDEETRVKSGSGETTYKTVLDKLEEEAGEEVWLTTSALPFGSEDPLLTLLARENAFSSKTWVTT